MCEAVIYECGLLCVSECVMCEAVIYDSVACDHEECESDM